VFVAIPLKNERRGEGMWKEDMRNKARGREYENDERGVKGKVVPVLN
jgi:hypothetical protein